MTVYLVTCNWYGSWQIGIFSSHSGAYKAIEKHIAWMQSETNATRNRERISKNDYEISAIPLDIICDEWYNDYINSKE